MNSTLKGMLIGSALALVSSAPASSESAARSTCPKGYAPLGEICVSALNGDIVLPTRKKTTVSAARPGR